MLTKHVEIRYARSRTTSRNAIGTQFPHSSFCFFSGTNVKIKFFLAFSLTSSHLLATCSLSSALASAPLFLFRLFRFRFLPLISPADNFFFSYPSPTNHHKLFLNLLRSTRGRSAAPEQIARDLNFCCSKNTQYSLNGVPLLLLPSTHLALPMVVE